MLYSSCPVEIVHIFQGKITEFDHADKIPHNTFIAFIKSTSHV